MEYLSILDHHYTHRIKYTDIAEQVGVTVGYIYTLRDRGGMIGRESSTGELTLFRPVKKK